MSLHFDQLFRKKLQKLPHFVKKHEQPSIWRKLATFRANYHVLAFSRTFQQKVAKSASFREKAREIIDFAKTIHLFEQTAMILHFDESSIGPKLATFSNKVPCLCVSMNLSAKGRKKCLVS